MTTRACPVSPDLARRRVGDPVDVVTGANVDQTADVWLPGDLKLDWWRYYDSAQRTIDRGLGYGFRFGFDRTLTFDLEGLTYVDGGGRETWFPLLERDGQRIAKAGKVLERVDLMRYRLHGTEPMGDRSVGELAFHDLDAPARLVRFESGTGRAELRHDRGQLIAIAAADGRVLSLDWQGGRIAAVHLDKHGERKTVIRYRYDAAGFLREIENLYHHCYRYEYDGRGLVTKKTDLRGYSFFFEYDGQGRCTRTRGEDGLEDTKLEYVNSAQTVVTRANGGQWLYTFEPSGTITEIRNPLGGARTFLLDDDGRVVSETDPGGTEWKYVYGPDDAPVEKVDALGRVLPIMSEGEVPPWKRHYVGQTPLEWELGQFIEIPDRLPDTRALAPMVPKAAQGVVTMTDIPGAEKPEIVTELQGIPVREEAPDGSRRTIAYDENANPRWYQDFDGGKHTFEHASWNLRVGYTDPLGARTTLEYDAHQELIGVVDPLGTETRFTLDLLDRLTHVHRHGRLREQYVYDAAGNMLEKRDGEGRVLVAMTYAKGGLKATQTLASGDKQTFKYDRRGRLIEATGQAGKVELGYSVSGARSKDLRDGKGVEHRFVRGEVVETTVLGRFPIRFLRPTAGTVVLVDPTDRTHRFQQLSFGTTLRELDHGGCELSQFDARGACIAKVAYADGAPEQVWARRFEYSGEGDLKAAHDSRLGTRRFVHDAAHRLTEVQHAGGRAEVYRYDAAGNLQHLDGLEVSVRQGNMLGAVSRGALGGEGVETFEYDRRDHLSAWHAPEGTTRYVYDAKDHLIRIEYADGRRWEAEYDALGRRTCKRLVQGETTSEWRFYWDEDRLAAEVFPDGRLRVYVYADLDALVPALFFEYDDVDSDPTEGRRYYVYTDHLGCPQLVQDAQGQTAWRATISAYGQATVHSGADFHQPFRWPGHYFDAETGLHDNRFRTYSPELGRYLQSDPSGFGGGANLYSYCASPVSFVDLRGLNPNCPRRAEDEHPDDRPGPDGETRRAPIPEGGISVEQRRRDLEQGDARGKLRAEAEADPANFYYDPASGRYCRREGRPRRREHGDSGALRSEIEKAEGRSIPRGEGVEAHHIIPASVDRDHPLTTAARERAGRGRPRQEGDPVAQRDGVDRASNGIMLRTDDTPDSSDYSDTVRHRRGDMRDHPEYNRRVREALDRKQQELLDRHNATSLDEVPSDDIGRAVSEVEDDVRGIIESGSSDQYLDDLSGVDDLYPPADDTLGGVGEVAD